MSKRWLDFGVGYLLNIAQKVVQQNSSLKGKGVVFVTTVPELVFI
jgi:hypothetical protein